MTLKDQRTVLCQSCGIVAKR